MLRHLDLFSGIGGFALAARMVGGYETIGFCEIEPYCQAVLRKHWPGVPIYDDVRSVQRVECEVITGGFPCQPFSDAGKRMGREDDRHLWPEYRRVIEASRPAWVLGENVPGIVSMELDNVLADLGCLGYSCQTFNIPACAVGAWHRRERIWIVAHAPSGGGQKRTETVSVVDQCRVSGRAEVPADDFGRCSSPTDPNEPRLQRRGCAEVQGGDASARHSWASDWWESEPDVDRVVHGLPARVDRIKALGNAIVPQVAAIFLEAIKGAMKHEQLAI